MQYSAQAKDWIPNWPSHTSCEIKYTATTTRDGLEEFGNGSGGLKVEEDPSAEPALDAFVAVDTAPNAGELGYASSAEGGGKEITVPVAQTPISILLSLPTKCTFSGNLEIKSEVLQDVWAGELAAIGSYEKNTWGALLERSGSEGKGVSISNGGSGSTGCGQSIERQARSNAAGSSFIFKSYLGQIDDSTWGGYATEYDLWPVSVTTTGNISNSSLARHVAETPGSIGYADAWDAAQMGNGEYKENANSVTFEGSAKHDILWGSIEDSETTEKDKQVYTFAPPSEGEKGDCSTGVDTIGPGSIYDSWGGTIVSSPKVGEKYYPICGLDYVLAWHSYTEGEKTYKSKTVACETSEAVHAYLKYVTSATEGQGEIKNNYNSPIPSSIATEAREAAEAVGAGC